MTPDLSSLLRQAETYLTVTHEQAARHDVLGADFTCCGCQLRGRITAALAAHPADQNLCDRTASVVLGIVEAALEDTLVPAARDKALAGIAAVLPAPADRAAVLREAADAIDATFTGPGNDRYVRYGAALLRRMADEAQQDTGTDAPDLTPDEARQLVDELGLDLYRAQDALAFVEECCAIADRQHRAITTANVREWLKGARCGRQLLADRADAALPKPADPEVFGPEVVAYRDPTQPRTLLCRAHGDRRPGLTPQESDDLPDGGICTHPDCGVDVLAPQTGESRG